VALAARPTFQRLQIPRQHPIGIYYLDFFYEEAELNVELDGSQHGFPDQRKHDAERERFLKSRGIKTLRFWNSHLRRNAQCIRDTIFNELQTRAPHPLPEYTRPMKPAGKVRLNNHPHPGPLLQERENRLPPS